MHDETIKFTEKQLIALGEFFGYTQEDLAVDLVSVKIKHKIEDYEAAWEDYAPSYHHLTREQRREIVFGKIKYIPETIDNVKFYYYDAVRSVDYDCRMSIVIADFGEYRVHITTI